MALSPQWLDELRTRISLSGVIGRTTRLTKAGHEFKACCPFHNEKSPSFTVNDVKGFYHCFGCGAHGDAIRWMTDQRGLSFMDAVKELATEAGLELPAMEPGEARKADIRAGLHDVMAAAQDWFVAQLAGTEGGQARAYLATRGFDAHTCARFGFGYAPEGRQALKAALKQFPEELLVEAGLRIAVDGVGGDAPPPIPPLKGRGAREPYDRFRGRLMLPIADARGRAIAFGGRILDKAKTDAPKYLNSPDTPLFDKGRTLYNLHRAGPVSRQSGRLIVVEGYMDVIALAAAGYGECVAPLGTALTEQQIELLWRLVETPVLCFDGDAAGQRAALRAAVRALPLLRPAHSLRIVRLPAGMDPDDLVKRDGPHAMERLLGEARGLLDMLWEHERDALPLHTPEDKAGLKARLMAHVETITDPDIKALYRREWLTRFSDFAFPRREAPAFAPRQAGARKFTPGSRFRDVPPARPLPETARASHTRQHDGQRALICAVVAGLLRWPDQIAHHAEMLGALTGADSRISAILDHIDAGGTLESAAIATILRERGLSLPSPEDYNRIRYPFVVEAGEREMASQALTAAIAFLVEEPLVNDALEAATVRFDLDEIDRLRKRKALINERLMGMAAYNRD